ncbi:MAG: matrixin family metalloprotease [Gemmatimonadota bacterium]
MQVFGLAAVALLPAAENVAAQSVVPPGDTYVESLGAERSGSTARWRPSPAGLRVLKVYFGPAPPHRPEFWDEARRALRVWEAVSGAPLRFETVREAKQADVEFRWIERFSTAQAGSTHRRLDDAGFIEHVTVVLADAHSDGVRMSDEFIRLVALHEVGHVVGLPHSQNPADAMHPGNRNLGLSPRDLRSVRVLYGLPPDPTP